jgi:FAD/FMN-containing dehydrogenase
MTERAALPDRLGALLGPQGLLTDPADLDGVARDWRGMFRGRPVALLRPATAEQTAQALALCRAAGVPVTPQGGNTGLAGAATPDTGVVLSLARMRAIRDVDPVGLTLTAEAGAPLIVAKQAAADKGRLLPISLASEASATVGGVIATNAGGVNVVRYGMARTLTLGLEVALPDGTVADGLRRLRKDNAGPDWKQMFIGSEGTLGVVTATVLRLVAAPRHTAVALLSVPDPEAALRLFDRAVTELGDSLTAFELIAGECLELVARHGGPAAPGEPSPWRLLIEAGSTLPGLREAAEGLLMAALEDGVATDGVLAESGAQAAALWALRERITEAEAHEGPSVKHDVSVPLTAIPDCLAQVRAGLARVAPGARLNVFGHMGDGNLHVNVLTTPACDAVAIARMVHDVTAGLGGSISAEHGLGQYRVGEWLRLTADPAQRLAGAMRAALDPDGIMNPGKGAPARRFVQDGHD